MSIIVQSDCYDVIVKRDTNSAYEIVYTVIYGLQVKQFTDIESALNEFNNCLLHSATCKGEFI